MIQREDQQTLIRLGRRQGLFILVSGFFKMRNCERDLWSNIQNAAAAVLLPESELGFVRYRKAINKPQAGMLNLGINAVQQFKATGLSPVTV